MGSLTYHPSLLSGYDTSVTGTIYAAGENACPSNGTDKSVPKMGLPRVNARSIRSTAPSSERIEGGTS